MMEIGFLGIDENCVRHPDLFDVRADKFDCGIFMINSRNVEPWVDPELQKVQIYLEFLGKIDKEGI